MSNQVISKRKKSNVFKKENIPLHLMALPGFLWFIIFSYLPMAGLLMAFQRYNARLGIFGSEFVGFDNFRFLFASTETFNFTRNTVLYFFVYLFTRIFFAVTIALILSMLRTRKSAKVLQSVYLMPYFLSWAVVATAVNALISQGGGIDQLLRGVGFMPFADSWYMTRSFWPPFLVLINSWKYVGYWAVIYLAVISGISADLYEAAMVDGAGKFKQAWYITVPHLRFIITISIILAMADIVRGDIGLHYAVPNSDNIGFIIPVIDIIDTYIFRGLRTAANIGMSAAATFYQSVVGLIMILISNWIARKIDAESAMF